MSEWWTYRLADFLLFSPATYYRMFELYNRQWWPLHALALVGGALLLMRPRFVLPVAWLWVAWAFLFQRYATINWGARWFAAMFVVEALLLLFMRSSVGVPAKAGTSTAFVAFALVVMPVIGILCGRTFAQIELFGMTPDPTVAATLGILATRNRRNLLLAIIPAVWVAISAATMWTLHSPEALVLPLVGVAAMASAALPLRLHS